MTGVGGWYYVVEEVQTKGKILSGQTAYETKGPIARPE